MAISRIPVTQVARRQIEGGSIATLTQLHTLNLINKCVKRFGKETPIHRMQLIYRVLMTANNTEMIITLNITV